MTVDQAVENFIIACYADGLSAKTIRWYESILSAMCHTLGTMDVNNVAPSDMRQYVISLRQRSERYTEAKQKPTQDGGLSRESIASHVRALHRFWRWAFDEYGIDNPMARIKRQRSKAPEPKAISPSDFIRLFNATGDGTAGARDRAILSFLADTGCRLGGLLSLKISGLDLVRCNARIVEKGLKQQIVYFTHYTALLLDVWLNLRASNSDYVFTNVETGAPLTPSGVYEMLKRRKRNAGVLGRVNPHSFRHNFARQYLMNGGDVVTLAKFLGHASIQTTVDYYAIFSESELADLHRKHSPLLKMLNGGGE